MAYFRPLELEMDMEAAMRGVPIIAVMLVLPNNKPRCKSCSHDSQSNVLILMRCR